MIEKLELEIYNCFTKEQKKKYSHVQIDIRNNCIEIVTFYKITFADKIKKLINKKYDLLPPIIASFNVNQLHGCCGVGVFHNLLVTEEFQNQKIGTTIIKNLVPFVTKYISNYGLIICTDVIKNIPMQKLMERHNWLAMEMFKNPKTGNMLKIHGIKTLKTYSN